MILAGDVGGTKTFLARFDARGRGAIGAPRDAETYQGSDFPSLEALIRDYLAQHPGGIRTAALGVAGVVTERGVHAANLPWPIHPPSLARALGLAEVRVINDLVATGFGIAALTPSDLAPLKPGTPVPRGTIGILAAGTGLGEATLLTVNDAPVPVPSEGGHADFAPRTEEEVDLWRLLKARFGRVSCERVLSGPGLVLIAEWTHTRGGASSWQRHRSEDDADPIGAVVSREALEGRCAFCREALDRFAAIYGAEAGNLALRSVAVGGIYLGGGIAPRILPALESESFRSAFLDKDPHRELLASIPVWAILNEQTALLGAARYATLSS